MNRKPVISSNLSSVGYDAETHTLEVEFNDGIIYLFSNVSPTLHNELMNADSHGKYFARNIRKYPNIYPYKRIK